MPSTLSLGGLAPSFSLEDLEGRRVRLDDHRGRRVLVALLRNARCAICNLWVHTTERHAAAWREAGLDVIAVFESPAERLRAQFAEKRVSFPVLADPDGAVHEAYGSRSDPERVARVVADGSARAALCRAAEAGFAASPEEGSNFFRLPAEVLVERDGTIALAHVAEDVTTHLPPERIARFARDGARALGGPAAVQPPRGV